MDVSAFIVGLYLSNGLAMMDSRPPPVPPHTFWWYDINSTKNPYGLVEIGDDMPVTRNLIVTLAARHQSSIPVNDFGTNTLEVRVRWYPFAR